MKYTVSSINIFLFFKLPSVWWSGIRVKKISLKRCRANVRLGWFNKNPFKSLFWAVQGMAAELTTGMLIMQSITTSKKNISMLVLNNKGNFSKKAKGLISFNCCQGEMINETINRLLKSKKPQTLWVKSVGKDESGDIVSSFDFEWTLMLKK
ncbi:MAG: thioesterase [Flavobacteriaceae bacterium]|nr:thioesterase [Flavobacteriaceae bacterium]|tara:strand:- start:905 stop:1360 length:456 start_codon:yes stop_codon:yes gene_type:complete